MNRLLTVFLLCTVLLTACVSQRIADVKQEDMIGKTVTVSGTVESSIKIGDLSAYTLKDSAGDTIDVSDATLPADGTTVTARGVLMHDTIFGYYIKVD